LKKAESLTRHQRLLAAFTINVRPLFMNFSIKKSTLYFIFFMAFCFIACHDEAALKQALIEKMVQKKIDNHITIKRTVCFKEAMTEALVIADSAMIKMALSKVDTSGKINRPAKPLRPEIDLPVDTTPIRPLFEDTISHKKDTTLVLDKSAIIQIDTASSEQDSLK